MKLTLKKETKKCIQQELIFQFFILYQPGDVNP